MRTYILAIGINKYSPERYGSGNNLSECVNDAWEFTKAMPADYRIVLIDSDATYANVINILEKHSREAKAGDRVIWYQSSHGTQGSPMLNWSIPTGRCMQDRILWDFELPAIFKKFRKGVQVITISDCCYSESNSRDVMAPPMEGITAKRLILPKEVVPEKAPTKKSLRGAECSIINISASRFNQVAWEAKGKGGFFTNAFLESCVAGNSLKKIIYDTQRRIPASLNQHPVMEYHNARALIGQPFMK